MYADPKTVENTVKSSVFFALLGSGCIKASRKILAKSTPDVFFTQNTAEIDQSEFEKIDRSYICSRFLNIFWIWVVDLKSFEPVHGLSRVVRLIPDKLATAIEINKENLDDPKDDGSFLVDLVTKLLKYYQGQIKV